MDFAALLPLLRDLSPYVAVVLLLCGVGGYFIYRKFNLKEKFLDYRKSKESTASEVVEKQAQLTILTKVTEIDTKVNSFSSSFTSQLDKQNEFINKNTEILGSIHRELIRLNAAQPGKTIGHENAKKIILYQWNWCRDETSRLLINSIINNHYHGNENETARKVLGAWKDAARDAYRSITSLDGISYPVEPLFKEQIRHIWTKIWELAVPVYHRYSGRAIEGRPAFEELSAKINEIFDQVYDVYTAEVEDIDNGLLYRPSDRDSSDHHDDLAITSVKMASVLKEATISEDMSSAADTEILKRMVKKIVKDYKGKKRTKSGQYEPQDLK
jgi:hypothetical protein